MDYTDLLKIEDEQKLFKKNGILAVSQKTNQYYF